MRSRIPLMAALASALLALVACGGSEEPDTGAGGGSQADGELEAAELTVGVLPLVVVIGSTTS